ncbi:MAG: nucleoside kinase [Clostridia bacterium]|nr:nucleoside kinase [Clostridia bacterium]
MLQITKSIINNRKTKFVLVAGPSSSGKTTTSHILQQDLLKVGICAKVISLDNFFLDREETPYLPSGDRDYDSVNSIDWKLFDKCVDELLNNKSSILPIYDFLTGVKRLNNPPTTLLENEIIIIEGLHALNPIINNFIPHEFSAKVFVIPQTSFSSNGKIQLDVFSLRLMRRIIRDVRTRGISPETTLDFWKNVRAAEDLYVLPFEKDADFIVDTTHAYEPYVYKNILSVLLVNHIQILQELLFTLNGLLEIKPSKVPETSLLKEFVG